MSVPISAISTRAVVSLRPGIVVRRLTAARKGPSASPIRASIVATARLEGVDLRQVQLDHEAMVVGDAPMQRVDEIGAAGLQSAAGEVGQALGISLARDERGEDRPAAHAHDVAHHLGQLDVGVLEGLLHTQDMPGDFPSQLPPRPREIAEVLDRRRRDKTAANQPVRQQIRNPRRIIHVALAARHVADVHRIGQHQREVLFQHVPHGLPVDAGGFHRHVRTAVRREPLGQRQQPTGRRRHGVMLVGDRRARRRSAHRR